MSEDRHTPPQDAPIPDGLQDDEPTDKPAAKGIWISILAVFVISVVVFAVIYANTHDEDAAREHTPPPTELVP